MIKDLAWEGSGSGKGQNFENWGRREVRICLGGLSTVDHRGIYRPTRLEIYRTARLEDLQDYKATRPTGGLQDLQDLQTYSTDVSFAA